MTTGIIFARVGSAARVQVSKRADLSRSRMEQQSARRRDLDRAKRLAQRRGETIDREITLDVLGVVETETIAGALKLRRVLLRAFASPGSGDLLSGRQVADALVRCRRIGMGLKVYAPETPAEGRRPIFNAPVIDRRYVPDPMMTRATLLEQLDRFPNSRWVGWTKSDVNLHTLIGGLARVKGKTEAQIRGAAEYRNVAERAQIGGARAIDYTRTRVDSSGPTENAEIEGTEEARRNYAKAVDRLGHGSRRHIIAEKIIVQGMTVSQVAEEFTGGKGGAVREKITAEILEVANELAVAFGFAPDRLSRAKSQAWSDVSQYTFTEDGEMAVISTRKSAA